MNHRLQLANLTRCSSHQANFLRTSRRLRLKYQTLEKMILASCHEHKFEARFRRFFGVDPPNESVSQASYCYKKIISTSKVKVPRGGNQLLKVKEVSALRRESAPQTDRMESMPLGRENDKAPRVRESVPWRWKHLDEGIGSSKVECFKEGISPLITKIPRGRESSPLRKRSYRGRESTPSRVNVSERLREDTQLPRGWRLSEHLQKGISSLEDKGEYRRSNNVVWRFVSRIIRMWVHCVDKKIRVHLVEHKRVNEDREELSRSETLVFQ